MPALAKALLRAWWEPEFALAHARVGYAEAIATGCPLRVREWRCAVVWLEWLVGPAAQEFSVPSLSEVLESIEFEEEEEGENVA